jgi:murein DD-endopeptidase MepM/ murein hydrolase activator NlpD
MVAATAAAALAMGTMSAPAVLSAAAADPLKDKQKRVEKKIDRAEQHFHASSARSRKAQARLEAAQAELDGARSQLAVARGRLEVAEERDAKMQAALEAARARLEQARQDLATGREEVADQHRSVVSTITDFYEEGDPDLLAIASILDSETTADLTRRTEARNVIVGQETRAYDELHAAEVLLEVRERQVEEAEEVVAQRRAEAAENLEEKQALEAEAQDAAAAVRSIVGKRRDARSAANRAKARDERVLRALEREQAQIQEMLRRRAQQALRSSRGSADPDGFLSPPTSGYLTSPFGYRKHPIYGYWGMHDGVDYGGGCGLEIRAAAGGRVVSSYWSDSYGRRLIVDHGAVGGVGLATIYNHAASYNVGVGSTVARGQVIGHVGNTGWSTACHLHFTVTSNGRPVDPMNWF